MCTWRPEALWQPTRDVPCTLTWQFFIRDEKLELHVNMRSNDVWLGLPYDLFNFTSIQRHLAARLDVGIGDYYHHVGSLHLYEPNLSQAITVLQNDRDTAAVAPSPAPYWRLDRNILNLLEGLPRGLSVANARAIRATVLAPWQSYAGVLLHRFSKDRTDLDPYFADLIS
jgi:thymidylate synthase